MMVSRTRHDLAEILSRTLGIDAARAHVDRAAAALGVDDNLTSADALFILEALAGEPGIVGISARFAKARIHLAWDDSAPRR